MDEDPPGDVQSTSNVKKNAKEATNSPVVQVTKKLKSSVDGTSVSTAMAETTRTKENNAKPARNGNENNGKGGRKSNIPFQRCKPDQVSTDIVMDNRYEAKVFVTTLILLARNRAILSTPSISLDNLLPACLRYT
jgi:hypothetical protein